MIKYILDFGMKGCILIKFIEHFAEIEEPRSDINRKYDLLDVIFLTVCGVVSGCEGWKDIHQFGNEKLSWLRQYRKFEHGIPVDDTIARIISALAIRLVLLTHLLIGLTNFATKIIKN